MKTKTKGIIASVVATAILGSAVGLGTYSFAKTTKNNFGFKGTYSINALAATATAEETTVMGKKIDTTSVATISSTSGDYTLFVTVIDTADMSALTDITVGYKIGENYYNGTDTTLTNVVYSSFTVKTGNDSNLSYTAEQLATNFSSITTPKLVIAEVETSTVGENTAELSITAGKASYTFTADVLENAPSVVEETKWVCDKATNVSVMPGMIIEESSATYTAVDGTEYNFTKRIKGGKISGTNNSVKVVLKETATVTVIGKSGKDTETRNLVIKDAEGTEIVKSFVSTNGTMAQESVDLEAGTYYIGSANSNYQIYGLIITTAQDLTAVEYTKVDEVSATCTATGTKAHYKGSDGKLYQLAEDGVTYNAVTADDLVIAKLAHTTTDVEWTSDEAGHWHVCTDCKGIVDYAEHTDTDSDGKCDVCGVTILTETVLDIKDADGNKVGSVSVYGESDTFTYEDLVALITISDGYELTNIIVDGTPYTTGDIPVTSISTITATITALKTEKVDISTLSSSYAVGDTVYDGTLFTMSTKIKLTKKNNYIVTNSGKTDSSSTPIVFTAKQKITLSLKANVGNSGLASSFTDTNYIIYQIYNSDGTVSGDAVSTVTTKTSTFIDLSITLEAGQYVNLYFTTSSTSNRYFGFSLISATI